MSIERTARIIHSYLYEEERQGGGHNRIAEDAVYTVMATGQQVRGYQAVVEFLDSLYRGGLQAGAKRIHEVIGYGSAAFEIRVPRQTRRRIRPHPCAGIGIA